MSTECRQSQMQTGSLSFNPLQTSKPMCDVTWYIPLYPSVTPTLLSIMLPSPMSGALQTKTWRFHWRKSHERHSLSGLALCHLPGGGRVLAFTGCKLGKIKAIVGNFGLSRTCEDVSLPLVKKTGGNSYLGRRPLLLSWLLIWNLFRLCQPCFFSEWFWECLAACQLEEHLSLGPFFDLILNQRWVVGFCIQIP